MSYYHHDYLIEKPHKRLIISVTDFLTTNTSSWANNWYIRPILCYLTTKKYRWCHLLIPFIGWFFCSVLDETALCISDNLCRNQSPKRQASIPSFWLAAYFPVSDWKGWLKGAAKVNVWICTFHCKRGDYLSASTFWTFPFYPWEAPVGFLANMCIVSPGITSPPPY